MVVSNPCVKATVHKSQWPFGWGVGGRTGELKTIDLEAHLEKALLLGRGW